MAAKNDISSDEDIKLLVHTFYDKVQQNERLGYIFSDYAAVQWDNHLPQMIDFWSNLLFRTGRYNGRPFRQHLPLPIEKDDFNLWLGLWKDTVDQFFVGDKADFAKEIAGKIAASFSLRLEMEGKYKNVS